MPSTSTPTTDPANTGATEAPDPAQFATTRRIADILATLSDPEAYRMAAKTGGKIASLRGKGQPLVKLPDDDIQLGRRWTYVLQPEQMTQAQERGLLADLLDQNDPDESTP